MTQPELEQRLAELTAAAQAVIDWGNAPHIPGARTSQQQKFRRDWEALREQLQKNESKS